MKFRFWCEFPGKTDWKKLAKWLDELDMNITTYVACTSRKNFDWWKREIRKESTRITINAWPTLSQSEGYWFSGFVSKKNIDLLDDFKDIPTKIDVEPPMPKGGYSLISSTLWLLKGFLKKAPNRIYLQKKIKTLDTNGRIIASTFPLPHFLLKRMGWTEAKENNFMFYPSFVPKYLRFIYRLAYIPFIKLNKNANFAIGLIGKGIFNNEPIYKDIKEFKTDIEFLKRNKVKKVFIFELSSITKRGKQWLSVLKQP
ncbi:MAG: hypothetical protein ABIJ18_01155 [archaeon]